MSVTTTPSPPPHVADERFTGVDVVDSDGGATAALTAAIGPAPIALREAPHAPHDRRRPERMEV